MAPTKLVVNVEGAKNLMPKDGQGSSSAYVQVEFDGIRKTTKVIKRDLDPVWREVIDFPINDSADIENEVLDINVFDSSRNAVGKRSKFLGRVNLHGSTFVKQGEETLLFYKLDKKGIFSPSVRGELGLTIFYIDGDAGTTHHASNAQRSAVNADRVTFNAVNADRVAVNAERSTPTANTAALSAQVAALNAERDALNAELAILDAKRQALHASKGTSHRTDHGKRREHGESRTHSAARSRRSATKPSRSSSSMPTRPPPVWTPPDSSGETSTSALPAIAESNGHLPALPPEVAKSIEQSSALPPSSATMQLPSFTPSSPGIDCSMDEPLTSSFPLPPKIKEPPLAASETLLTGPEVLPTTVADPPANILLRTSSIVAEASETVSKSPLPSSQSEEACSPTDEQQNSEPNGEVYEHVPEGILHVKMKTAKGMAEESLLRVQSLPNVEVVKPMTETDFALRDTRPILGGDKASRSDLVERMHYLFVRVVKARSLMDREVLVHPNPYILVASGNRLIKTLTVPNSSHPEWHQVFVFGHHFNSGTVDISVWDQHTSPAQDCFLGSVSFDLSDIPTRLPPDGPLAPEWFQLEHKHGEQGTVSGAIMLSLWIGTQADEAYSDAWHADMGGHMVTTRAKVYLSPKLWYLRLTVIEAQDLQILNAPLELPEASVKVCLGFQSARTRVAKRRSVSPFWNEDLMLVASEPFEEEVVLNVEDHQGPDKNEIIGVAHIRLDQVEQRVDDRLVPSKWFNLENTDPISKFQGRIHLRVCLDGGYHVTDEATHLSSDMRPSAKKLWKAPIGVLELGILGAHNLLPMKNKGGRGMTDAYCVAKYGPKWVRTRTVLDSLSPQWNEQYTWEVFEPCTVLTLCVFDNGELVEQHEHQQHNNKHARIGKVRVRLSTLEVDRVYTISYPLMVLQPGGLKKVGDMEIAVRFSCVSMFHLIHTYSKPLLPRMHYLYPLAVQQQEILRTTAMKMVALRLSRCEPPLRPEIVQYMLDADSSLWSMRRSKANWFRISNMMGGFYAILTWMRDIRQWRNPVTTVLVHVLFIILLCYPELILPTIFFYMFLIGLWQFRSRNRSPPHIDPRISHADAVNGDELDEEFDTTPTSKPPDTVKLRYERLRGIAGRIQMVLGDIAMQGERLHGLLTWRDPRATSIFVIFCFFIAIWLYIAPFRLAALIVGVHFLRHPRFRDPLPSTLVNFFRRLPTQSDRIL